MAHAATAVRAHPRIASRRRRRPSGGRLVRSIFTAPVPVQLLALAIAGLALWSAVNWAYQVARKPGELLFPVSGVFAKTPSETWRQYGPLFRQYSTAVITPDLLAALAQVEGSGDPVARPPWRWTLGWNPLELYRPASSALGMFQITDARLRDAGGYCVRDHVVVESCRIDGFYARILPGHAVEMTAALLDRDVARTLERRRLARATLRQRHDLAAVIHLCGRGVGDAYAAGGFRLTPGQRCGEEDVARYVARVRATANVFARLAAADAAASRASGSRAR